MSEKEAELGFRVLQIVAPDAYDYSFAFQTVVAYVLSGSDILLKLSDGRYSHRRFGYIAGSPLRHERGWHALGHPYSDLETALHELTQGIRDEQGIRIIGVPFEQKRA
jgi:hypothetical protein